MESDHSLQGQTWLWKLCIHNGSFLCKETLTGSSRNDQNCVSAVAGVTELEGARTGGQLLCLSQALYLAGLLKISREKNIFTMFYYFISEVAQSCPTLRDPVDCSPPGSSVHGILQARILEWVAISFSRGSSRPRDRTQVSRIAGGRFNCWATREDPLEWVAVPYFITCL